MDKIKPVYGMINFGPERELATASFGYIHRDIEDIKHQFIRLGFHLYECQQMGYYKDFGYSDFYEFVAVNFHMEKSAVSRHISLFQRFSHKNGSTGTMFLDEKYEGYSYSQLCEMVTLSDNKMQKIKPDMTVAQIRDMKKSWKNTSAVTAVATSQQKQKKVRCSEMPSLVCHINEIQKAHFLKNGETTGCAGCCSCCTERGKCEYTCGYGMYKYLSGMTAMKQEKTVDKAEKSTLGTLPEGREDDIVQTVEYQEITQPELPVLKNNEQRKEFIDQYQFWPVWVDTPQTGERYYKYELEENVKLVVKAVLCRKYLGYDPKTGKNKYEQDKTFGAEEYYLFKGEMSAYEARANKSVLIDYLKEYQKKK